MMASKSSTTTILDLGFVLCLLLLLLLAGFGGSDLAQDRAECADKLIGLSGCLSYVGGEAKAPSLDCCNGFKDVVEKSDKCICLLIKDRNDPNLGIKINATLAVKLPSICHAPSNITKCIDLLHLAPNSKEAKEFEDLAKLAGKDGSTPSASTASNATAGTTTPSSSNNERSGGGWDRMWMVAKLAFWMIHVFFLV